MIRIHTWLVAAMLLMVSQRAAAADFYAGEVWGPYIENFTKSIDITGNLHYSFDLLYYDHEKEGYFWGASTGLYVDGTLLFKFSDLLSGWYQPHKRYPEAATQSATSTQNVRARNISLRRNTASQVPSSMSPYVTSATTSRVTISVATTGLLST